MTPTAQACAFIWEYAQAEGGLEAAARRLLRDRARLFDEVMEVEGSWPSSEPEIRAMQRVHARSCGPR